MRCYHEGMLFKLLTSAWFLSLTLGILVLVSQTTHSLDSVFFSFLPNSANFSNHRERWLHHSLLSSKYPSDHCQIFLKFGHTNSHTTEILSLLISSLNRWDRFPYITKDTRTSYIKPWSVQNGCIHLFFISVSERLALI